MTDTLRPATLDTGLKANLFASELNTEMLLNRLALLREHVRFLADELGDRSPELLRAAALIGSTRRLIGPGEAPRLRRDTVQLASTMLDQCAEHLVALSRAAMPEEPAWF